MRPEAFVIALFVGICVGLPLLGFAAFRRQTRQQREVTALLDQLRQTRNPVLTLTPWFGQYRTTFLGKRDSRRQSPVIAIFQDEIRVYSRSHLDQPLSITPDQVRWFGRPEKYTSGANRLWLHIESPVGWYILKFSLSREDTRLMVQALKTVLPEALTTAYRRQRPYIHQGPTGARRAEQDIYGAWTLFDPLTLYLMPTYLLLIQDGMVERKIPLEMVKRVAAVKRLDGPGGMVRFDSSSPDAGEETLAYSMSGYETFATALAEAAKRSLEEPLEVVSAKKKKDEDDF